MYAYFFICRHVSMYVSICMYVSMYVSVCGYEHRNVDALESQRLWMPQNCQYSWLGAAPQVLGTKLGLSLGKRTVENTFLVLRHLSSPT